MSGDISLRLIGPAIAGFESGRRVSGYRPPTAGKRSFLHDERNRGGPRYVCRQALDQIRMAVEGSRPRKSRDGHFSLEGIGICKSTRHRFRRDCDLVTDRFWFHAGVQPKRLVKAREEGRPAKAARPHRWRKHEYRGHTHLWPVELRYSSVGQYVSRHPGHGSNHDGRGGLAARVTN
jgi:hypothetical protein